MPRAESPASVYSVSSSDEASDYASEHSAESSNPAKRPRLSNSGRSRQVLVVKGSGPLPLVDIEDTGRFVFRHHATSYHAVDKVAKLQPELLAWFEDVREKRGMPWRKKYDPAMSMEEKGQRAYEIWVSEVMLQQTQVNTVIAYWQKWIERWPTIADLAGADIEEVNSAWRGLGYYRRARSLLQGAKTVMGDVKYAGRLPDDPAVLEKEISGVGKYTAGAICSMAYGVRAPIVDGNIHRLFTRLLAIHAPQTAPQTIKQLWSAAEELINELPEGEGHDGVAGDWNQALMELGSQVCRPIAPACSECPLKTGCKGLAETTTPQIDEESCDICVPMPTTSHILTAPTPDVTMFPMKKVKKASKDQDEVVCITEWRFEDERHWLFVKRPDTGLLAGLFEPPTIPTSPGNGSAYCLEAGLNSVHDVIGMPRHMIINILESHKEYGAIPHIFSHINMKYHIQHLVIEPGCPPPDCDNERGVWLSDEEVTDANVGTGVKKVWAEVFGEWGKFEVGPKVGPKGKRGTKTVKRKAAPNPGEKIVKKVAMPAMPTRSTRET